MTAKAIRGQGVAHTPGAEGGGGMRIDRLYWNDSGQSDSDDFTAIPFASGETWLIWAWWAIPTNSDLEVAIYIDHDPVASIVPTIQTSQDDEFTGSFFTALDNLTVGDHTVGLSSDGGALLGQGGIIVMHVPSGSYFEQSRLGG